MYTRLLEEKIRSKINMLFIMVEIMLLHKKTMLEALNMFDTIRRESECHAW